MIGLRNGVIVGALSLGMIAPAYAETTDELSRAINDLRRRLIRLEADQKRALNQAAESRKAELAAQASLAQAQRGGQGQGGRQAQGGAQAPTQRDAVDVPGSEAQRLARESPTAPNSTVASGRPIDGFADRASLVQDLKAGEPVRIYETAGTSVRLYALVEATISYANNVSRNGRSAFGYQTSWFSGNRWGLDASQVLDPASGLQIIAKLESEFELPTGNMDTGNVLFNRDAWIGFQAPQLGKLTFGRQNTLPRDVANIYGDPYGAAALSTAEGGFTNVNNFKQIIFYTGGGSGANGQGDTRLDNGIVYKKLFDNGLFVGLAYAFSDANGPGGPNGSGTVPGAGVNHGSVQSVAAGYNGQAFHVSAFYNHTDVFEVATEGAANRGHSHQSAGVGGNYTIGPVRVNAGYLYYTADQGMVGRRTDHAVTVSAKYAPNVRWDYELGWQDFFATNAALTAAGYTYTPYKDASAATTAGSGTRMTVYGSAFYHPAPNVDIYLASDYLDTTGHYKASQAHGATSAFEAATGVRWRF